MLSPTRRDRSLTARVPTLRWRSIGAGLYRPADAATLAWSLAHFGGGRWPTAAAIADGVADGPEAEIAICFLGRRGSDHKSTRGAFATVRWYRSGQLSGAR